MNEQQFESKVRKDAAKIREDLDTMMDDGTSQFSRVYEKAKGDVANTLVGAVASVKKEVGHGLNQYNAKAEEFAKRVPGDLTKNAAKYPWVAITLGVGIGLLVGFILKPSRTA